MRYFVAFSYFGKAYHGWQIQPNAITVQEVLEQAFTTLLRTPIALVAAGRTDAGVHAKEMFAHFECNTALNSTDLVFRLNNFLPEAIAVQAIFEVQPDAHARFHATARTYEYWITPQKNPFYTDLAHYVKHPLNIPAMNTAAAYLLTHRDFECFSKSNTDVHTYFCTITKAHWEVVDNRLVFTISADRFLRNMVRAIVGTLLNIGLGKATPESIIAVLESKNRSKAGASMPAKGLYLTEVRYPEDIKK